MARPLYQRLDNTVKKSIYNTVQDIMAPIWKKKVVNYWIMAAWVKSQAPKYIRDNWDSMQKFGYWYTMFTSHYQTTSENGVGVRIAFNLMFLDFNWDDIKNDLPSEGITLNGEHYSMSDLQRHTTNTRYFILKPSQWVEQIAVRTAMCIIPGEYTQLELFQIWESIGAGLWKSHPTHPSVIRQEKFLDDMIKFIDDTQNTARIFNIIQTYLQLQILSDAIKQVPGLENIGTKIEGAVDQIFSVDKLVNVGVDVLKDTVQDQLDVIRKSVVREIEELDDRTTFNLSALADHVNESSRLLIDGIDGVIEQSFFFITEFLQNKADGIDAALNEPQSKQALALKESNMSTGAGFVTALKLLLFSEKEPTA
jgi:hypothetical protein